MTVTGIDQRTVDTFRSDGIVVLDDPLPSDLVQRLRQAYDRALRAKIDRFGLAPVDRADPRHQANDRVGITFRPEGGNHDLNRWNMHLPSRDPFLDPGLVANPAITGLVRAVLGEDCVLSMLASDTPLPGAGYQSFHQDFARFAITVNIPLTDVTDDDGPLEAIPGTHRRPGRDFETGRVAHGRRGVRQLVDALPARRYVAPAGTVIVRDQRLIHRGTAHRGRAPRPMLALWYKSAPRFAPHHLSVPAPHRGVADRVAEHAAQLRRRGRGAGPDVASPFRVNAGNLLGRLVDELSATDRDSRRPVPADVWHRLPGDARHLMRYAVVEGRDPLEAPPGSVVGSAALAALDLGFAPLRLGPGSGRR
jgi:hypothetical protein